MNWRHWLCWPCIACGVGLCLVSFASYAQQSGGPPIDAATYWRDVATGAIGLSMALVGWYMRSVDTKLNATSDALLKSYLTKDETRELVEDVLEPLKIEVRHVVEKIDALHKRFDQKHYPHVTE